MPSGLPTAEQLMSGHVDGFSIDTCIFESVGFRLNSGELGVLKQQLPSWLKLYLPSIVCREVIAHQVANVRNAELQLLSAIRDIGRHTNKNIEAVEKSIEELHLSKMQKQFDELLTKYVSRFNGQIIWERGSKTLQEMFDRYFSAQPPFETKKDKKNEFPDAASLISLEQLAKEKKKFFILVSNDNGWEKFCAQSEMLFCVKRIDALPALYQSGSKEGKALKRQVSTLLATRTSSLSIEIATALEEAIPNCSWIANAYTGYCSGVEAEIYNAVFKDFRSDTDSLRFWLPNNGSEICVVELDITVTCSFHVSAAFSTWDSIDKESVPIGLADIEIEDEIKMPIYITIHGKLSGGDFSPWDIAVEVSQKDYEVDVGEIEPDYSDYEE